MTKSLYRKVGLASFIMMASVFLSRLIGLPREMIYAHMGGAAGVMDAYFAAFMIPDILNHIVATGFLSITFIPIFSKYLVDGQEDKGWEVLSVVLACFGGLLIVLMIIAFVFTPELVSLITPGFKDPLLRDRAVKMTRIIMPAQVFFFMGGLLMAVQFAKEKFFLPALAPLIYNLGIIAGGLILAPFLGVEGFAWGVLGGACIGNFLLQYYGAAKIGFKFRLSFNFKHPDLKKYILMTMPLMLGLTMMFSTEFLFRFFGSYMPRGDLACLNYGFRLMLMLVGFFGQAVGMAMYPFMSRLIAENRMDEANKLMNEILRLLGLVIPVSILIMVLRHEVVFIPYQHGKFGPEATRLTSQLLVFFMISAFAFTVQTVVVRGYYASQNTLFPAIFMTVMVLLSLPLYHILIQVMGTRGIALGVSISSILQVMLLYTFWNRKSQNHDSRRVYVFYLKIIALSLVLGGILEWFKNHGLHGIDNSTLAGCLIISVVTGTLFLILLMISGRIFKIREIDDLYRRTAARLTRKKKESIQ